MQNIGNLYLVKKHSSKPSNSYFIFYISSNYSHHLKTHKNNKT